MESGTHLACFARCFDATGIPSLGQRKPVSPMVLRTSVRMREGRKDDTVTSLFGIHS